MKDFVILVDFRLKPGAKATFRRLIDENARASCRDEPGCRRCVCESADGREIFLYEIYDDEAAFQAHLATDHYKRFNARTTPWVADKRIVKYRRLSPEA